MAKQPPKRYSPGELEAVKQRLGELSPEEQKKMAELLGGEVGIEKSPYDINKEKFRNFGTKGRGKPVDVIQTEADISAPRFKKISDTEEQQLAAAVSEPKKKFSYIDRVKTDFLCRKPEYGLKSLAGAIGSLFSFFLPVPDYVKPSFLEEAEKNIYRPIADLVKATRGLYTKTREEIYDKISTNRFYARILKTIKTWDIESIEHEIYHLKKRLQSQNTRNLLRLCKMVYYPVMILSLLNEGKHILAAYQWAYNANVKGSTSKISEKERLISLYYDVEKNIPYVLNNLKKLLYPVLMKRISSCFLPFEEFLIVEQDNLINFLTLKKFELIDPENEVEPEEMEQEQAGEEQDAEKNGTDPISKLPDPVLKGLNCLEKLYPRAGWFNLEEFPDLYPYFQPIYNFPGGFELVPATDPLHQVIILLSIINDLFYGFRNIKFGMLRDKNLEAYNIQGQVESLISPWPLYIDEVISKVYISRLVDYCRQIEKEKSFRNSEVGKKIVTEMNWIKKNYLLPFLSFKLQIQVVGIIKRQLPRLYVLTTRIRELLSQVVDELKQKTEDGVKAKFDSISNPWAAYVFDLENSTSKRLGKILYNKSVDADGKKKIVDRRNNANLLFYTVSILSVLDYYLNNKESHLYFSPSTKLFRSLHDGSDIPQYSVQMIDPDEYVENLSGMEDNEITGDRDRLHVNKISLKDAIKLKIAHSKTKGLLFSMIYFNITLDEEAGDSRKAEMIKIIEASTNLDEDIIIQVFDFDFIIFLENSDIMNTIQLAKGMAREIGREQVATGVIQYQPGWEYHYFQKILDKTKQFTNRQGPGKLVYLDVANNKFKSINI